MQNYRGKNTSARILKIVIFIIARRCEHGCYCHIQRIILTQEPSLNSTALLRCGQKTRVKITESCTIVSTENWQNILAYRDD